ncbi:hypothetical protein EUGRSUZ_F01432 [Eucalyptus grandis]|uniref:Uncharacterized protein n=2 Tax=Eucalyptus grandis TaxID=71139 RepID=A0ACC3KF54_EUCGR|nr:hypothetical protein EUGRSUZ_F01432 [Eucalyptus grandis]
MVMILVGGMQGGTMVSLASAASVVSAGTSANRGSSEVPYSPVRKIAFPRGKHWSSVKRWHCKYSVTTTDFIAEHTNAVSLDSNNGYGGDKDDDNEILLKPAPRPVVKPSDAKTNSVGLEPSRPSRDSSVETLDGLENKNNVLESLDEVLEKAEKLEKSNLGRQASKKEGGNVNKSTPSGTSANPRNGVWRKGDNVAAVQKVKFPMDSPDSNKVIDDPESQKVEEHDEPRASLRPAQPPLRLQPKLQAKPSVAPPPALKKPVILKDVGAAPKSSTVDDEANLIDKFATKKPVVDPLIAQAVLAPTKPSKGPASGKFKDDYRKKNASAGGPRRRMVNDDIEIPDEEASELNVSIPGAASARKGRKWSKASRKAARLQAAKEAAPVKVEILEVGEQVMLIEDLAYNLATSEGEILGLLYSKGIKPDGVQTLDKEMLKMVCKEYEVEVIEADPIKVEEMARKKEIFDEDDLDKLEDRPPVLTIMGHVDHGKTTLLDYIRKSKVAASEARGIMQGIGAYKVLVPVDGKLQPCVFLDTPGHEVILLHILTSLQFGAMRARGARVTDIAIIVVAADDGIRPQTSEAIAHAKAAGVPIVIAINKIDKDGASPEWVMQEPSSVGLMPEDRGGDIPMVQVHLFLWMGSVFSSCCASSWCLTVLCAILRISALKGENVDDLLETVMLVAELQELKANPHRNAKGTVIEAGLHKSKGSTATFIVQNGTLKRGDVVVCGGAFGKVRALFDENGKQVLEAGPSIPVQVIGLNNIPIAGDEFEVVGSLDTAREKAEARVESLRNERISAKAGDVKVTLSSLASAVSSGKLSGLDLHQLNIIMKVDVQAPGSVKSYADNKGVEIRLYRVIYELIDDVRNAMEGLLESVEEQEMIGSAEVRAIFSSGSGRVAGCMVTEGKVVKGCGIRVVRKGKTAYVGILDSLRRVKEIVKEVGTGLECGIGMEDYDDWEEGDIVEAFNTVEKRRTLEEASASMTAALEDVGIKL